MKSNFFPRRDEIVLSTLTMMVALGLCWQGFQSMSNVNRKHSIFSSDYIVTSKK